MDLCSLCDMLQSCANSSVCSAAPVFELASVTDFTATKFPSACSYDRQSEHVGKIKHSSVQRLKRHKSYAHNMTGAQLHGTFL